MTRIDEPVPPLDAADATTGPAPRTTASRRVAITTMVAWAVVCALSLRAPFPTVRITDERRYWQRATQVERQKDQPGGRDRDQDAAPAQHAYGLGAGR